jgi:hypothetical protein
VTGQEEGKNPIQIRNLYKTKKIINKDSHMTRNGNSDRNRK